jgi:hypothetical protein
MIAGIFNYWYNGAIIHHLDCANMKEKCMACECPCDEHKVHDHPSKGDKEKEKKDEDGKK